MSPPIEKIEGKEAKLVKDGTHPIYVLPDGRFAVRRGGSWITRTSFKAIEKVVNSVVFPLLLFRDAGEDGAKPFEVIEITHNHARTKDGRKIRGYRWYLWDESLAKELARLHREKEEAEAVHQERIAAAEERLVLVTRSTFEELRRKGETDANTKPDPMLGGSDAEGTRPGNRGRKGRGKPGVGTDGAL